MLIVLQREIKQPGKREYLLAGIIFFSYKENDVGDHLIIRWFYVK